MFEYAVDFAEITNFLELVSPDYLFNNTNSALSRRGVFRICKYLSEIETIFENTSTTKYGFQMEYNLKKRRSKILYKTLIL